MIAMLHQLTIKNFKSIRDEVTLDMTASAIKEIPDDVVVDASHEKVLKLAAIYGANASGKSNVLAALKMMAYAVLVSFSDEAALQRIQPYWFEDPTTPTEFSVLFSTNDTIYQYGFSSHQGLVDEEFLYQRDKTKVGERYLELYRRDEDGISGAWVANSDVMGLIQLVPQNALLLSTFARVGVSAATEVLNWFKDLHSVDYGNVEQVRNGSQRMRSDTALSPLITLLEDDKEKSALEHFIQAIDVGIAKLGVVTTSDPLTERQEQKHVVSYHRNPRTGKLMQTPISAESSGTRKMLVLYVDLHQTLSAGGLLVVDELDAQIHPLLMRYILIMFHSNVTNPHHAQLIFSTQDIVTLDKRDLRRDEIWFVDKDQDGCSDLYSLDSLRDANNQKVRNDASYGKDYLLGKFRATPNLRQLG
ncbi:hypothetical protein IV54_GL001999 [Levilactobacillus paucivorans]|uniref:ATPase AAA-type core domain-containing protein n=1 Tax=Levilactobacillus paucivorans TaxID=616990 RepID=A0A0R2LV94_9LACO|nr:hypothetical protein IV54_GL001999 [Levilactobacillus paucivorans]